SGLSKIVDNRSKEIVLTAYGEVVKQFVVKMFKLISKARNETINWQCLGLDDYRLTLDREQILKEATSMSLINIPSRTFKKAMLFQVASQFLNTLSPQEQLVIKQEISDSIDTVGDDELYTIGIEKEDDESEDGEDNKKPINKEKESTKDKAY
ncbi:MAG: hypothetical protein WAZ75_01845, partial [Candidatus Absconditicoccaceae bacterium]